MSSERASSELAFWTASALLFAAGTAATIGWSYSMPPLCRAPGAGGWAPSMAWVRLPGETWLGAAASFLSMWSAMMVAMMLPSLVPMLRCYRRAIGEAASVPRDELTMIVAAGYFFVWTVWGLVTYPLGVVLAALEVEYPAGAGVVVFMAGLFQFTAWKAAHLASCREMAGMMPPGAGTAWRNGLRLGLQCSCSCAGLMASLLADDIMDLRAMMFIAAAIAVERLAPPGARVPQLIGGAMVVAGLVMIRQVAGPL